MGIEVAYSITVKVYNIGEILLSNSSNVSVRTKNICVSHCFVRDYVEDRIINIEFVCSEDNWWIFQPKSSVWTVCEVYGLCNQNLKRTYHCKLKIIKIIVR